MVLAHIVVVEIVVLPDTTVGTFSICEEISFEITPLGHPVSVLQD